MPKFMVTLTGATSMGSIVQCAALTAKLNGKPIATVGDVATYPQASDVLVEGVPGILLNGKPIVCSGGKTAMGACVMPNTCVKVSTPETYVGFAVAPLVDTKVTWESTQNNKEGNSTDNKEAMQGQTGGEQQNETVESSQNEEPEESENVTFESDFAPNELTDFAKTRGKVLFMISMNRIFGYDGTAKAIEKLYDEAYEKPIENPEFVVCKNKIQGKLDAAYSSETHKIYINEQFLREAVHDNDKRHELMIAIVEEYGHHLDYLIRYVYDNNENKDAEGDEGARFAYHGLYEIFDIDFIDTKETPFGTATIDGTQIEFKWEYADVYEALQRCTAHRLEGTDDHYGEFEGFDVTGKKSDKYDKFNYKEGTGANHEKIQQDTFNGLNGNGINEDILKKYALNSRFFYRGNWLRDMPQVFAPIVFRFFAEVNLATEKSGNRYVQVVGNPDQVCSILTDIVRIMALRHFKDEYTIKKIVDEKNLKAKVEKLSTTLKNVNQGYQNMKQAFSSPVSMDMLNEVASNFVKNITVDNFRKSCADLAKKARKNIEESKKSFQDGYNTVSENLTAENLKKGLKVLQNMYTDASKEFKEAMAKNFNWRETFVDGEENGLIPGLGQALGVSVTHDHCDNPKGLTKYPGEIGICAGREAEVRGKMDQYYGNKGFLRDDVKGIEIEVDKTYGIKHHLKSTVAGSSFMVRKTVVENVAEKLSAIKPNGLTRKNAVVLGGALHTLQDFYAHSNYCEVYLSKYFKSVITWTDADYANVKPRLTPLDNSNTKTQTKSGTKQVQKPAPVFQTINSTNGVLNVNGVSMNALDNERYDYIQGKNGNNRIYKKPFYAPITSGTCDMEDLLVCGMHLVDAKLDSIFFDLEEKMKDKREEKEEELKPHQLTINDIAIFALLELGKEIADANQAKCYKKVAKAYYGFILLRETKVQLTKEMKTVTEPVKKKMEELLCPNFIKAINKEIEIVKILLNDLKTYIYAILVKIALFILLNFLEQYQFKDITKSTFAILNDMKMPEKPCEISFALINSILTKKYGELKEGNPIYHSPLGRLYNGEDPSHTVLAKDSGVHPINEIAGMLATATSVEVLLDHMNKSYSDMDAAKKNLGKYIAHPLASNIYDEKIREWAYIRPQNVIKASLTVCVLERMLMKFKQVMIYKNRICNIINDNKNKNKNKQRQDQIFLEANQILNRVLRGVEQVDLNKLGGELNCNLHQFKDIFTAYFNSMYFELDACSFIQFTEDHERLVAQRSNKTFIPTRSDDEKRKLMDKWKIALKKNVQVFLESLTNTNDDEEVQLRIPLLADLDAAPKVKPWVNFAGNLAQPRRDIVSEYSLNLINKVAEKNQVRITITSTIRSISQQASAMYTNLSNGRRIRYTKPGQAVTAVYDEYTKKGASKKDTLAAMERKIAEYEKKGERVSLHCVSEETYAKLNVIDLYLKEKSDKIKVKAVIQDLLNSGVSRVIQKDFPNVKEFSYKPTQRVTYIKSEPCIHVEIKQ